MPSAGDTQRSSVISRGALLSGHISVAANRRADRRHAEEHPLPERLLLGDAMLALMNRLRP